MSVKRLLDCTPSELARYTKAELLDAIAGTTLPTKTRARI